MSAEFATELVGFCVFFSDDGHLGDGGVGHNVVVLSCRFINSLEYILFIVVDGKLEWERI